MTSERSRDGVTFCCDVCGELLEPAKLGRGSAPRDWQESWQDAKAQGWRAVKNSRGGEWSHRCPAC
jgi:hypothetical protein